MSQSESFYTSGVRTPKKYLKVSVGNIFTYPIVWKWGRFWIYWPHPSEEMGKYARGYYTFGAFWSALRNGWID